MPKTKDAFAFRFFDSSRILQRRFFKEWREAYNVEENKSDEEILKTLSAADDGSIDALEKKLDMTEALLARAANYQKHLKRHGERMRKYIHALLKKIASDENSDINKLRARYKRANLFSMAYFGCVTDDYGGTSYFLGGITITDIGGLCEKIANFYKEIDEDVRRHYRKIFADRLKFARQSTGLTQREFARKLNISQNGLSLFETAKRDPSIPMLIRFSKMLGRSADWLLGQVAW